MESSVRDLHHRKKHIELRALKVCLGYRDSKSRHPARNVGATPDGALPLPVMQVERRIVIPVFVGSVPLSSLSKALYPLAFFLTMDINQPARKVMEV